MPDSTSPGRRLRVAGSAGALTFLEMIISLAIMAVVFSAVLPQFRNIQNSWASRQGGTEALQNGRILIDHMNKNLSSAERITAVSNPDVVNGFIEFEANDSITYRYEISLNKNVQFGPVGSLSELAGPVSRFNFICYDAYDLDTPVTDVGIIRAVRVATTLTNQAALGQDKNFSAMAYLRANSLEGIIKGNASSFGITTGNSPSLAAIDATHYLCAYAGVGDDGWAVVLDVDTATSTVSNAVPFEYDISEGVNPSLAQIDAKNYLCAYTGPGNDGWAVILKVDTIGWSITKGTPLEFEIKECLLPSLAQIDAAHYLCTYTGPGSDGWAVMLLVNTGLDTVTMGTPFEFDASNGTAPSLVRLDAKHFLCVYQGWSGWIWAVVLTADIGTETITKETAYSLGLGYGNTPALSQIDDEHFLCAYSGNASDGMAVVIAVDDSDWSISRARPFQYDVPLGNVPTLVQLTDRWHYLCSYQGDSSNLWATVFTVDEDTWDITNDSTAMISPWKALKPDLVKIDDYNYLCVYEDQINKGWGLILNVGGVKP